jgi:hypothetical protein
MGIAAGVGAHRPAPRLPRCRRRRTRQPTFSPVDRPLSYLSRTRTERSGSQNGESGFGGGNLFITRRLERADSPDVSKSPGPGSPGPRRSQPPPSPRLLGTRPGGGRRCGWTGVSPPPATRGPEDSRAEPLLRGRLLGKGRLLEPKLSRGQNARLRAGIEKETDGVRPRSLRANAPRNFHCTRTACRNSHCGLTASGGSVPAELCGVAVYRPAEYVRSPERRRR